MTCVMFKKFPPTSISIYGHNVLTSLVSFTTAFHLSVKLGNRETLKEMDMKSGCAYKNSLIKVIGLNSVHNWMVHKYIDAPTKTT